jgi:predicted cupin superfamily sugar epimerase
VGKDIAKGERTVWIVEGGKYKASYLLDGAEGERLLISEVSCFFLDCSFAMGEVKLTLEILDCHSWL